MDTMICHACGFTGDDVQDFISTDTPGERYCPTCQSADCHMIEEAEEQEIPHAQQ